MTRSKQITYENLLLRDTSFVAQVRSWFNTAVRANGFNVADDTPPMFTPFKLREMVVHNRVVVSPMAQYSATNGMPNDWHLVHLFMLGLKSRQGHYSVGRSFRQDAKTLLASLAFPAKGHE